MITFLPEAVEAKDPDETKFYYMDWSNGLIDDDTISSSTWVVQSGVTAAAITTVLAGAYKTRVTLSGGLSGNNYACTNRVVTVAGETLERTGILRVRER